MTDYNSTKASKDELPAMSSACEEALEWFTRLADTPVKAGVQLEFLNWCAENPENKQAYDQITELWGSDVFAEALKIDEQRINHKLAVKSTHLIPSLALAASLLLGVWGVFQSSLLQRLNADSYTTVGQQQTINLVDGSSVILDTDSAIAVSYNEHIRKISLLSGRAFFNVQPDSTRPFIVKTDDERIRVVGTRFTVNSESSTPLTVQQGIVTYQTNTAENATMVIAGEQLEKTKNKFEVFKTEPTSSTFAWTDGRLIFSNQQLAEIIAEIDRYQPGIIVLNNHKLAGIRVTGNYKLNDPEKIIASLAQATGAKVTQLSKYLTILM